MKVENGDTVQVHYRGTFADGVEFDNSRNREKTLDFEVGTEGIIRGFNNAVLGMSVGETKTIVIDPENGYGQRDPDAFRVVPRAQFGEDFVFELGGTVRGNGPMGQFLATIHEIQETQIVLDFNHPLAGKELTFEIELVSIDNESQPQMVNWNAKMKKAELFEIAKSQGLSVNTRSTKAQIIEALSA